MRTEKYRQSTVSQTRRTLQNNERRTKRFLAPTRSLELIDSWLQMLLDCHVFAVNQRRLGILSDYMEAYAMVSSMALANAESALILLLRGLYANAAAILRTLTAQNDLVVDLSLDDESLRKWLKLKSFGPDDRSKEAKALMSYFWDSAVRKRLVEKGESPLSDPLSALFSEVLHATPRGSHLYSRESLAEPGTFYIQHSPQYEPKRAILFSHLLLSTLPNLVGYFLQTCDRAAKGTDRQLQRLMSKHFPLLHEYETQNTRMLILLAKYEEFEARLAAGEDFDSALSSFLPPDTPPVSSS